MNQLLIAGAATIVMATRVMATGGGATTYTFTSANYNSTSTFTSPCSAGPCANYTTAMNITGSFTIASPLAANLSDSEIATQVTSYSFSDGINTYSNTNPNVRIFEFLIFTDANGQITGSNIYLELFQTGSSPHSPGDRVALVVIQSAGGGQADNNTVCVVVGTSPAGVANSCTSSDFDSGESSAISDAAGTWSVATAPPVQSVPTLGQWGTISLAALLILFGWLRLVRPRLE